MACCHDLMQGCYYGMNDDVQLKRHTVEHSHHNHFHNHSHGHAPADFNRAFAIGIVLNLLFVGVEAGYGLFSGSLALVADAGHNLSDVMTLLIAWAAMILAKRSATARHTFGYKKGTILASLGSTVFLYVAIGVIVWEAIGRLRTPVPVQGTVLMVVAAIGVAVNTLTALLFLSGRKRDLNIKAAFLHMAADALVSLGVVGAGLVITLTGWNMLDPLISLLIALFILAAGWGLLKDSLHLIMAGVPSQIDAEAVLHYLSDLPGVQSVYDLHIWAASTTENVLTVHLVMPDGGNDDFLYESAEYLRHHFAIHHTTIQIECSMRQNSSGCGDGQANSRGKCWPGHRHPVHDPEDEGQRQRTQACPNTQAPCACPADSHLRSP